MGSYGDSLRCASTRNRSQAGKRRGALASLREAPLTISRRRGSSENDLPPSCLMVVPIAALWHLIEAAESFLTSAKKAR